VTSGVLSNAIGMSSPGAAVPVAVVTITALMLLNGRYVRVESLAKILVMVFTVLTLLATVVAVPRLFDAERAVAATLKLDVDTVAFLLAMTGWMPLPVAVTAFHSVWVREKVAATNGGYTRERAAFDLNVGWLLTLLLALCFVVMGTAVLFGTDAELPASAAQFAGLLFSIYTSLVGDWVYPVLAIGGVAVIWSTLLAIMDAVPRLLVRITRELRGIDGADEQRLYRLFLITHAAAASIVLVVFLGNFSRFIDFAASTGFLVAPAMAWFNYRAVRADDVARDYAASPALVAWNWISIVCFTGFAAMFFIIRFTL
jgi:Mn2+/Fe2+ NRAMP family transporter